MQVLKGPSKTFSPQSESHCQHYPVSCTEREMLAEFSLRA